MSQLHQRPHPSFSSPLPKATHIASLEELSVGHDSDSDLTTPDESPTVQHSLSNPLPSSQTHHHHHPAPNQGNVHVNAHVHVQTPHPTQNALSYLDYHRPVSASTSKNPHHRDLGSPIQSSRPTATQSDASKSNTQSTLLPHSIPEMAEEPPTYDS